VVRFSLILLALLFAAPSVFAKTIPGVTVCAIACNSELENTTDIAGANTGTVYFAQYTDDTKSNSEVCMEQSQHLPTLGFRPVDQADLAHKGCSQSLHDKFFGKKVDILVAEGKNNISYVTEVIVR